MCEMAPAIAAALAAEIASCGATAARIIVKILGYAGAGHEAVVGRLAEHRDGQVAREAMRALARIGTATAAALVARQVREGPTTRTASRKMRSGTSRPLTPPRRFESCCDRASSCSVIRTRPRG